MSLLTDRLNAGSYDLVRYVDPWGRHITRLDVLIELMPEWVDVHGHRFRNDAVTGLADPGAVGPQVWESFNWHALSQAGLGTQLHLPSVFSFDNTMYVVRMDSEVYPDDGGGAAIVATPLVVDVDGTRLANIDLPDQMFHIPDPHYLLGLRAKAMRLYPPISLALLHTAGLDLDTVKVLDGRPWEGDDPGATTLRARPVEDFDFVDANLLCGEDGPRVFLSELPRRVGSLSDAFDALCPMLPNELPRARRQGSWWLLQAPLEDLGKHGRPQGQYERSTGVKARALPRREYLKRVARRKPGEHPPGDFDGTYEGKLARLIPESDHFATEVVRGGEGALWIRGLLRHARHAHAPLKLETWHRVYHNGQVQAWSMPAPVHH